MTQKLSLFVFIDAMGWSLIQRHPFFLEGLLDHRKPLDTILGYSNGCDPSIITGLRPMEHGYWNSYFYSPHSSPFRDLTPLAYLPDWLSSSARVRNYLSRLIKSRLGFTGYFQLYNTPFSALSYFDYAEQNSIWIPGGMAPHRSIFDLLYEENRRYFVDDSGCGDDQQFLRIRERIKAGDLQFAYVMLGKLDALMHLRGTEHPSVARLLRELDGRIRSLVSLASEQYEEVALYVFSDHGMHDVRRTFNLQTCVTRAGLQQGRDYVAYFDSTMARFWFLNRLARDLITETLAGLGVGHILSEEELKQLGVYFPNHRYGDCIYLMDPGTLIVPSFMGIKPIAGMHGFHPNDPDSTACILSNRRLPDELTSIEQIFHLMCREAEVSPQNSFKERVLG